MTILLFVLIAAYGGGALIGLLGGRGPAGRAGVAAGAVIGAGAGLALGAWVIASGRSLALIVPDLLPLGGGLALRLDPLGAFFLILIGVGAIPAAIYGFGYSAAYEAGPVSLRRLGVMLNLFLLAMSLVPLADNVLTFLFAWEAMSLTSYFLVITESEAPGTQRAGLWYLGMAHFGFAALVAMFMLLAGGDLSASFATLRSGSAGLAPGLRDAVFLLALVGFGSKAGIVPLHVWLPMAHPVAPSHISALMSGVLIKMGIYGLLRLALDLLGGGPAWWGGVILIIGSISAVLGVLYALMEHDLKRLLAYHSVENIGIILIGIGAGLVFHSYQLMPLAALGIIGGLYHTLNHATFKSLLFLGAGSVLHTTHTRNMEELGGLIKRMPWTALGFLIGAAAISALPPLNGFASEWLVFQTLLSGFQLPRPEVAVLMPVAVGLLALTSGLAAACFVKAFGITFLALPRSHAAETAEEAPRSMRVGMGLLALLCVGLGLAPFAVVPVLGQLLTGVGQLPATQAAFTLNISLSTPNGLGQMSPALVAVAVGLILVLIPLALRALRANRQIRYGDTWGCGRSGQTPRMEYTATAFAEPLRRVFAQLYRPAQELTIDFHPESKYFIQSIAYKSEIMPWFEKVLYEPTLRLIQSAARQVRKLQSGSLHLYLAYLAGVLLVLIIMARWF